MYVLYMYVLRSRQDLYIGENNNHSKCRHTHLHAYLCISESQSDGFLYSVRTCVLVGLHTYVTLRLLESARQATALVNKLESQTSSMIDFALSHLQSRSSFLIQPIISSQYPLPRFLHHFDYSTRPSIRIAYKLQLIQANPPRFMSFAKVRQGWPRI